MFQIFDFVPNTNVSRPKFPNVLIFCKIHMFHSQQFSKFWKIFLKYKCFTVQIFRIFGFCVEYKCSTVKIVTFVDFCVKYKCFTAKIFKKKIYHVNTNVPRPNLSKSSGIDGEIQSEMQRKGYGFWAKYEARCKGNAKGFLQITKRNAKEMLRLFREIQSKIQMQC